MKRIILTIIMVIASRLLIAGNMHALVFQISSYIGSLIAISLLVLIIWLIVKAVKNNNVAANNKDQVNLTTATTTNNNNNGNNDSKTFVKQKIILDDLRVSDIISDSEYRDKLNLILKKERKFKEQEQNENINNKVNERIKPFINKLMELTKQNVLSKKEFEQKRDELIIKYTKIIQEEAYLKEQVYTFERISRYELTGVEFMGIARLQTKLTDGDMILKSKKTKIINIYSQNELNNILSNGELDNYLLIDL